MDITRLADQGLADKEQLHAVGMDLHTPEHLADLVGGYDVPSQPADGVEQQVVCDLPRDASKRVVFGDGGALLKRS